jgi:hypothetical protein
VIIMKRLLIAFALFLIPSLALAASGIVTNSQGTSGAPLSVTTVAMVIPRNTARYEWCIEPETVAIRIAVSTTAAAPSPAPSTTVGFYIAAGTTFCERLGNQANGNIGAPINEVDAASTAGATNVDTWEENGSSP